MLQKLLEKNPYPLIAVHRGKSGACVPENTVYSGNCALASGADIVEFDVARTLGGGAVVFHLGMESKLLSPSFPPVAWLTEKANLRRKIKCAYGGATGYRLNTLEEFLQEFKGKCILNFDRIWCADIVKCLETVKKLGMFDQILFKSEVIPSRYAVLTALKNYPEAWFMPICKTTESYRAALKICPEYGVKIRGFEVLFGSESDFFCSDEFISEVKARGQFAWVNTINLSKRKDMCAGHSDRNAIFGNAEEHWGFLADKGFAVIQTDWPGIMKDFFKNR